MEPYYEDEYVTLYHGDCREVLPDLSAEAVVTDPPYGVEFEYESYDDSRDNWFRLIDETIDLMRQSVGFTVVASGGIDKLKWWYNNYPPDWVLSWYKGSPGHLSKVGFNDWEAILTWGTPYNQMHDHFQTPCGFDGSGHPCAKPMEWANWLVRRAAPEGGTVIDPFAGSGTTLRAAKDLGRKAVGIEIEEKYCRIITERPSQEVLAL